MKKVIAIILTISALALSLTACGGSNGVPVIGINQYGEHTSLDNCREGFLLGLAEAGLTEGEDFTVDYQNASFDNSAATQIAQSFSSKNVALMCAIATPSATACYAAAEDKNIPVVFNAISDPEEAALTDGNITGVSDKLPVEAQLQLIRRLQPSASTIGIIYTTSEPNSVSAVAEYKKLAGDYGFAIEAVGVADQASVTQAADTLISKNVDCFTNLTDNGVVGVLPSILEKTNSAKIPVYGSEIEQVNKGCIATAGIDYVELGKAAGKLAAQILKGEKTASEIPYETVTEYALYINDNAAAELGIEIPTGLENATHVTTE